MRYHVILSSMERDGIRRGVVVKMPSNLPQIAGYVPSEVKDELVDLATHNRRLSLSSLVSEAIEIAMPELRARYGYKSSGQSSSVYERASRRKKAV